MVGGERPRQGTAVEGLQHRRLHLDEAGGVEVAAYGGDDARAVHEQAARVLAGDQVELAVAVARLDVAQAVVLVGRRAQGLAEQLEVLHAQRDLTVAAAHRAAVDAQQVAEVKREQQVQALAPEHVQARVQLELAGAVDQVQERGPTGPAARGEPAGDAVALVGFLTGRQVLVGREDRVDRLDVRERVGEGGVVAVAQPLSLLPALGDQLG